MRAETSIRRHHLATLETPNLLARFVADAGGVGLEQATICTGCRLLLASVSACGVCGRPGQPTRALVVRERESLGDELVDFNGSLTRAVRTFMALISGAIAVPAACMAAVALWDGALFMAALATLVALYCGWTAGMFVTKRSRWFQPRRLLPMHVSVPLELPAHLPVHRGRVAAGKHAVITLERQLRLDGGGLVARQAHSMAFIVTLEDGRDVLVPAGVARIDHGRAPELPRMVARGRVARAGARCTLFEIDVRSDQPVELVADLEPSVPDVAGYRARPAPAWITRGQVVLRLVDR